MTKGLVVDVAGASAWNIVSVMATLRFATDLTGFITDEYVIPSMGTDSARWVLGNSLGQLWTSDRRPLITALILQEGFMKISWIRRGPQTV